MKIKRWIVDFLETACARVDKLWDWPRPFHIVPILLGCPSGLALLSAKLDERWQTGLWKKP